jgi:dTDP-4-dehydrorhamnose reductase
MGERFVAANCRQHLICRAGWMMGGGPAKDKKFINKLMKQLKDGARELFVVDDKLGTPTYTIDFARNVELLLGKRLWGIYNMVCPGVTSRLEVARYLVVALGLAGEVKITPVSSDHFVEEYFAARPASERLITKKLDLRGVNIMRDWRLCLDEYLAEAYAGYLDPDSQRVA